jgi:hypothetical protein
MTDPGEHATLTAGVTVYMNLSPAPVGLVPPAVVTVTSTGPTVPGGLAAVI